METYVSEVKTIYASSEAIFNKLSDLSNLEKVKDRIPQDKIQDLEFDRDSCSFSVSPVGKVSISIVEREEFKTIKFGSTQSPMSFNLWIQLIEVNSADTRLRVTLKADIPFLIKPMVGGKLKEGINRIADALAMLPY
ncbi:MAG: SRPBCC family protein [Bacteroidales bacterium]